MPSVLDDLAKSSPNKLFASIPKTSDVTQGFRDITAADFARSAKMIAAMPPTPACTQAKQQKTR